MKKAVILVSGGLDSAAVLAMAKAKGYACYAVRFDYRQRHTAELDAAKSVAAAVGVEEHRIVAIDLSQFGGSALTDEAIDVPEANASEEAIPITYVPARNTVFLSLALAWSEVLDACDIFLGVNAVDYSGYPDCRPAFIDAYEQMANLATRAGVEESRLTVHAPLIDLTKAEIIRQGTALGVDYSLTVSCYQADDTGAACRVCESCFLRREGFVNAGIPDPTRYA
jgi:7-cyano-7-deazaguanine synthase